MLNRVFVCLSQTLVTDGPLDILENDQIVRQQGEAQPIYHLNPADRSALETAVQLKQNCGVTIVGLAFSPQDNFTVLKTALAGGADRCVHLVHPDVTIVDGWIAAKMISTYLKNILNSSDLILCGDSQADSGGTQVGPYIAELLDLPQITRVLNTTYYPKSDSIEAVRLLERGSRQRVACGLPAVAAISRFGPPGRYPAVLSKEQAPVEKIEAIPADPAAAGLQPLLQVKSISRPRPRTRKVTAPSAQMSAADRMKFLMSGGQAAVKIDDSIFEGSPDASADRIIEYLLENNLL